MEFLARRKKSTPAVIIVALIDVLIVVLIFLLVSTTFKQQPAVKLTLPESSQAESQSGSSELAAVKITIDKEGQLYLGANDQPLSAEELKNELAAAVRVNPQLRIEVASDTDATLGVVAQVIRRVSFVQCEDSAALLRIAFTIRWICVLGIGWLLLGRTVLRRLELGTRRGKRLLIDTKPGPAG